MEMKITFPGGDRVDASWNGLTVATDQDGSAPNPFSLFLASIGTCAGIYVVGFCRRRGIPTDGIRIRQRMTTDASTGRVLRVDLDIEVPPEFPLEYRDSVVRAANQCKVKRHLEAPPEIVTRAVTAEVSAA